MNYYNEHDPKAAAWLRALIDAGHIPAGIVDTRSISEVTPDDLIPYTQCHFFAGIGGWSLALRYAGWPATRPVWTGSCPCQPFSAAGRRLADKDPATSGPSSTASSPSARLQSSLESRLRARMAAYGSPEFALTWKTWAMPSGPPICALRASVRRTSANASTGWPTPTVHDAGRGGQAKRAMGETRHGSNLQDFAMLAGWTTPQAHDSTGRSRNQKQKHGTKHGCACLARQVQLVGWPTPCQQDGPNGGPSQGKDRLPGCAALAGWATPRANKRGFPDSHGDNQTPLRAPTETPGALNPAHSRWLMGFPVEWDSCGATAMQSCRSSRQSSSQPAKTSTP